MFDGYIKCGLTILVANIIIIFCLAGYDKEDIAI